MWLTYVLAVCVLAHGILLAIHIREDMKNIERVKRLFLELDRKLERKSESLSRQIEIRPLTLFDQAMVNDLDRLSTKIRFLETFLTKFLNDEK